MVASRSVVALTCVFGIIFSIILVILLRFAMLLADEVLFIGREQVIIENCAKVIEPGKWIELTYCREAMLD